MGMVAPPSLMVQTHKNYPDLFMLSTEACNGFEADSPATSLGSWRRGEFYSTDIMEVRRVPHTNTSLISFAGPPQLGGRLGRLEHGLGRNRRSHLHQQFRRFGHHSQRFGQRVLQATHVLPSWTLFEIHTSRFCSHRGRVGPRRRRFDPSLQKTRRYYRGGYSEQVSRFWFEL
jgi:hypothetical protein